MSQEFVSPLTAAIGLNDGANKGFWRIQPRDDGGQWVEMGGLYSWVTRDSKGRFMMHYGRAVGPTGRPGQSRMLVTNDQTFGNKIVEVPSHVLRAMQARIPTKFLDKKGIPLARVDKFGNKLELQGKDIPFASDLKTSEITDNDRRLSRGELTPEEREAERDGREKSPIANLPGGFESLNPEKTKELLRESGIEPDEFDKSESQSEAESKPSVDEAISDLFADVAYNGDTDKSIDDLINYKRDELAPEPAKPTNKNVSDLENGDIIMQNGQPSLRVVKNEMVIKGGREIRQISVQQPDGRIATLPEDIANSGRSIEIAPFRRPDAEPRKPRPAQPAETPAAETAPAAPTPAKPTPAKPGKPKPTPKPKAEKVNLPNRKDDGKDIAPAAKSREELFGKEIKNLVDQDGKLIRVSTTKEDKNGNLVSTERTVEDPNAIIDALLEENPNAKIKEDGTIVMERGTFVDGDGKTYGYEVGVQRTVGNQFMERYTITDPETGEVIKDFYNADYKDSFSGLYGKTSGLVVTRDYLLGRTVPGKKGVDEDGVPLDRELRNYFGPGKTLENRLKYLRKTKDMNNWRLLTPQENIAKYLTGRGRELNKSDVRNGNYRSQFGNVRRSFVASIYEAIDLKDDELVKERLVQALGRLPDTPESVQALLSTLKNQINERYKGTPRHRELLWLPQSLEKWLVSEDKDLRDISKIPFVAEDGVSVVKPGMKVRFINNEGDMVVGTVVKLNAGSGKLGGYKDTARVKFADRTVDNLQTRNMMIMEDDEPTTEYQNWVRLDEKLRRRAGELGIDFEEYIRRREDNPDYDPEGPEYAGIDAGAPYLGEEGESGEEVTETLSSTPIESKEPGDAFYSEDGSYIGTIIDVTEVPAEDGGEPGIAITYLTPDGDEEVEILEKGSTRDPK